MKCIFISENKILTKYTGNKSINIQFGGHSSIIANLETKLEPFNLAIFKLPFELKNINIPQIGGMDALNISVYSIVFFFVGVFLFGFLASDLTKTPNRKDLESPQD